MIGGFAVIIGFGFVAVLGHENKLLMVVLQCLRFEPLVLRQRNALSRLRFIVACAKMFKVLTLSS